MLDQKLFSQSFLAFIKNKKTNGGLEHELTFTILPYHLLMYENHMFSNTYEATIQVNGLDRDDILSCLLHEHVS